MIIFVLLTRKMKEISSFFSLVKFSHTIFAMPFALIGFFVGIHEFGIDRINFQLLGLVILCMVTARNAAMAFNRWADHDIDAKNPRTQVREIPAGIISKQSAIIFVIINVIIFFIASYFINSLCFYLSPVAILIVLGYSYMKRFSWLCHLILGVGLSLAPIGACLAVTAHFSVVSFLYGVAVISWVAGFDILYALQDIEFDRREKLHSIPARYGLSKSLAISIGLHIVCAACIICCSFMLWNQYQLRGFMLGGTILFLLLLIYQHTIVSERDLTKLNLAFFTTNGIASLLLAVGIILDFYF